MNSQMSIRLGLDRLHRDAVELASLARVSRTTTIIHTHTCPAVLLALGMSSEYEQDKLKLPE